MKKTCRLLMLSLNMAAFPMLANASESPSTQTQSISPSELIGAIWGQDCNKVSQILSQSSKSDLANLRCRMRLTVLHHAASIGNDGITELLCAAWKDKGLDLDVQAGARETTPAHSAVMTCKPNSLKILKKYGASCNLKRADGLTPLDIAEALKQDGTQSKELDECLAVLKNK